MYNSMMSIFDGCGWLIVGNIFDRLWWCSFGALANLR
jgi:hypothetical protein